MDLAELKFVVDTKELEKAATRVAELGTAVSKLNKPMQDLSNNTNKVSSATDKAAKAAESKAKADEKVVNNTSKLDSLLDKLNNRYTDMAKGSTSAEASVLQLARTLGATTENALKPYKDILDNIRELSKSPFDSAIGSVRSITQEYDSLTYRAELASKGIFLTTSQLKEYSRIANELKGKIKAADLDPTKGEGLAKFNSELKIQQDLYLGIANKVNTLKTAEKERNDLLSLQMKETARLQEASDNLFKYNLIRHKQDQDGYKQDMLAMRKYYSDLEKQSKQSVSQPVQMDAAVDAYRRNQAKATDEAAKANTYLAKEMERVNRLNAESDSITSSTNNRLIRFEQELRKSGQTAEVQASKLAIYRKELIATQKAAGDRQVDYLSRALGPQITDIAVGLATGQAPLTILLQQGGQLRDQFALAGVAGKDMGKMLIQAASSMVSSVKDVGMAIGQVFVTAVVGAGKSVTNFAMDITGNSLLLDAFRNKLVSVDGASGSLVAMFDKVGRGISLTMGSAVFSAIALLVALAVQYSNVVAAEKELTASLAMSGAALGMSTDDAIAYAKSMNDVGIGTMDAMRMISEFAKTGTDASIPLKEIITSAQDMQKYVGIASADTMKAFADISEKPVEGLIKLAKSTGNVTAETILQAEAAIKAGDNAEAARIAQEALSNSNDEVVRRMKNNLDPLQTLWMDIKSGISKAGEALYDFLKNSTTIAVFRTIWETIAVIVTEVWYVLKETGNEISGIFSQIKAVMSGDFTGAANIGNQMKIDAAASRVEQDKLIASIMNRNKAEKETLTITEEQRVANRKAAKEIEDRIKKDKDKPKPTAEKAIVVPMSKDISIIQKDYNEQLRLAEGFARDERSVLKARFDAGLIERADFITKDTELLVRSEEKQLAVIEASRAKYAIAYKEQAAVLNKALGDTKDEENRKTLKLSIENLTKDFNEFNSTLDDTKNKIGSAFSAREQVALLEFEKAAFASTKTFQEYARTQEDIAANKRIDLELQDRLSNAYGAEAAQIKAVAEETKRQTAEISKFTKAQEEAYKQYLIVLSNPASSLAQLEAAGGAYTTAMINANKAIGISRVSIENAGTDAVVAYYKQEYDRISNGVSDSIVTALFEGGKAGSKKLRDLIVAELKKPIAIVVKALVDATLGSFIQGVTGSTIGTSAAGSAAGTGGMMIGGATLGAQAGAFGSGFSSTVSGIFSGGAPVSSLGSSTSTAFNAGAYAPYVLAAIALVSLIDSMDDSGTYHTGGGSKYSAKGGLTTGNTGGDFFDVQYGKQAIDLTTGITKAVVGILDSTAVAFGKTAGYEAATSFADDTSKDGAWGSLLINKMGEKLVNWEDDRMSRWAPREFSNGQEGLTEYTNMIASDVRNLLIQETPGWADTMLNALGDAPTLENLALVVSQIGLIQQAFVRFGKVLPGFADISDASIESLLTLFGGVENLSNSLSFFYDNFFTEQEKTANLTKELTGQFRNLGLELPSTREAFRALVTTAREAGDDQQVKNLLDLQQSFAQLVPVTEILAEVVDEVTEVVDVMTKTMQDLLKERKNLEVELLQVQGRTTEANAALRKIATEGFTEAEIAAYDFNQSLRNQIQGYKDAIDAAKAHEEALKAAAEAAKAAAEQLVQTRKQQTDTALDNVRKAIEAEKALAQTRLDAALEQEQAIKAVFDLLSSTISDIRGQSNPAGNLSSARALISGAIKTGVLPDANKLSEALNIVRNSVESTAYATKLEQVKAGLLLANELQVLQDITEPQLSAAEQAVVVAQDQLIALDAQLEQAQLQVDLLRGIDTGILSVADAIAGLQGAISSERSAVSALSSLSTSNTNSSIGSEFSDTEIKNFVKNNLANNTPKNIYDAAIANGVSAASLDSVMGWSSGTSNAWASDNNLPMFANGGSYPGGLALVGETGPELINFNQSGHVSNAAQTSSLLQGSSSEQLAAIREELAMLRAETRAVVSNTGKTSKILDRATQEGDALLVVVQA